MKISFQFDSAARRLVLEPDDELERIFLDEITEFCKKGTTLSIKEIPGNEDHMAIFSLEMRINGFEKEKVGG